MLRKVLALDLATKLGWAYGDPYAGEPRYGSQRIEGADFGAFVRNYHDWLVAKLADRPDVIVFEEAMQTTAGHTPKATSQRLDAMITMTEYVCACQRIPPRQIHLGTWRAAVCPKQGNLGKVRAKGMGIVYPPIKMCRDRGWEPSDDNEADALGIWLYCASRIAPREVARFDPINRGLLAA